MFTQLHLYIFPYVYIYTHIYFRLCQNMCQGLPSFGTSHPMSNLLHVPPGSPKPEIQILISWAKLNSLREYHPGVARVYGNVKKIILKMKHIIRIRYRSSNIPETFPLTFLIYLLQEADTRKPLVLTSKSSNLRGFPPWMPVQQGQVQKSLDKLPLSQRPWQSQCVTRLLS